MTQGRIPLGQASRVFHGGVQRLNSSLVPKAHVHDPRIIRTVSSSRRYSDLEAQWRLKEDWARYGMTPAHFALAAPSPLDSRYPLQVQNTPYFQLLALVGADPQLLIPRNKKRFQFSITNFTKPGNDIFWSYGIPPTLEGGLLGGNTLEPGERTMEQGTSIAIDAIYVFTRTANPTYVIGWEGTIAPEANTQ